MRQFCIATEADMADVLNYTLLCDPAQSEIGLYSCGDVPPGAKKLTYTEAALVESATQYPPAIALTRNEAKLQDIQDKGVFLNWVLGRLDYHLAQQAEAKYLLAKSLDPGDPDLSFGAYYWILGISDESAMIDWVSRDFFIYKSPAASFHDPERLFRHFA